MIDDEFRELAGFDRGERETNALGDCILRKDRIFSMLAALAFDSPMILEKMEEALLRWKNEEKSEAVAAIAGYIFYCRGSFERAGEEFMSAISHNPENLDNWMDLAFALHHCEDPLSYAILFNYDEYVRLYAEGCHKRCTSMVLAALFEEIKARGLDLGKRWRDFLTPLIQ